MKYKFYYLFLIFYVSVTHLNAQNKITVSGYVKDESSGESVIDANIFITETKQTINTNTYGFYSLTLEPGTYHLIVSSIMNQTKEQVLTINADTLIEFNLVNNRSQTEEEVVITSKRKNTNVQSTQMGKMEIGIGQIRSIPALMGEVDLIKVYQYMPGVRNAGEGNAGFYVRGGGPDQNLILLDGAVVYNVSHLFGFFSVFNSDAIKNTSLIKGGMPAEYGGRISSVLEINMKEGNMKKYQVDAGISIISSRLSVQGPIIKDKSSFIITGRRTYIDILAQPAINAAQKGRFKGSGYYFYDLNAKINYIFSKRNRLFLSAYLGKDQASLNTKTFNSLDSVISETRVAFEWGNTTASLRWNYIFNNKLFSNLTAFYNQYDFQFSGIFNTTTNFALKSGIKDLGLKYDWDLYLPKNKIKFGVFYTHHTMTPSSISVESNTIGSTDNFKNPLPKKSHEMALFIQDDITINDKLKINVGIRESIFIHTGSYELRDNNNYNKDGLPKLIRVYGDNEIVKTYTGFEPRISARYIFNDENSIKFGYSHNYQYVHLTSTSGSVLPTDVWTPSTILVKPQIGSLYALGYFKNFKDNEYETSVEVYYKDMQNQIEYKPGYTPNTTREPEYDYVYGKGWSYGAEFLIRKNTGKLTGWIGYTLSWTYRQFPEINNNEPYFAKYDRRNDLSLVANYTFNKKWSISGVFVYASGNLATMPNTFYLQDGKVVQDISKINNYRIPAYHRMDISVTYKFKLLGKYSSEFVFGFYNIYSRQNVFLFYINPIINTGQAGDVNSVLQSDLKLEPTQVSLFPILPNLTWNFSF